MTRIRGALAALVLAVAASGCASTAMTVSSSGPGTDGQPDPAALSDTTSATTPDGTWAAVPMGGTGPNLFWQLFRLPGGSGSGTGARWSLETPPAIATNGALILAPQYGPGRRAGALTVAIRPSLDLTFAPVTSTGDGGRDWGTLAPASSLANVPDALASASGGDLLMLSDGQQVSRYRAAAPGWTALTSRSALAATAPGRACGLTTLTAVSFTSQGSPLLAGDCGRSGVAGIFGYAGGKWRLAGPPLPASLAGQRISVLRLTRAGGTDTALLEAGSGNSAVLAAASTSGTGGTSATSEKWTVSPVLRLNGAQAESASFGANGSAGVVLSGDRADELASPRGSWAALPELPPARSDTLALPAAGVTEALAATGSALTVWKLDPATGRWRTAQRMNVPIQYGSSSN